MINDEFIQTPLHRIVMEARDAERAAMAKLASLKPHNFIDVRSVFVPVKNGNDVIFANLRDMREVSSTVEGRTPRYGEQFSVQHEGTAFSADGREFHVAFTLDHDRNMPAHRHHLVEGNPPRDVSVIDLHRRAKTVDKMIGILDDAGLSGKLRYSPSVKTADGIAPADPFKKEENCFALYADSTDGNLRPIADFPTHAEIFLFMNTIKAHFPEHTTEWVETTCTSPKELQRLSQKIAEQEMV